MGIEQMVYRTMSVAAGDFRAMAQGRGDIFFGKVNCRFKVVSEREV